MSEINLTFIESTGRQARDLMKTINDLSKKSNPDKQTLMYAQGKLAGIKYMLDGLKMRYTIHENKPEDENLYEGISIAGMNFMCYPKVESY